MLQLLQRSRREYLIFCRRIGGYNGQIPPGHSCIGKIKITAEKLAPARSRTELGKSLSCQEDRYGYERQHVEQVWYQGEQMASFQDALVQQERHLQAPAQ